MSRGDEFTLDEQNSEKDRLTVQLREKENLIS